MLLGIPPQVVDQECDGLGRSDPRDGGRDPAISAPARADQRRQVLGLQPVDVAQRVAGELPRILRAVVQ